ncbi:Rrf2 family transcriptional regulator [Salinicoccus jeotgali]|uniref:Rrf2 family transcriptional regulator n=1 Tax=Salinicoccus jeotgali TaxID=381634 RepID=A0ABP7ED13_9STAP
MKMKTGVEQSVYAVILLNLLPKGAVLHSEEISRHIGASPSYFQKLLRRMVKADLIVSVHGTKGGFRLKRSPEDIRIYDIYTAIEGRQSLYSSSGIMDNMMDSIETSEQCILRETMSEAEASWKNVLKRENIADLTEKLRVGNYNERFKVLEKELQKSCSVQYEHI